MTAWAYGPAIMFSSVYQLAAYFKDDSWQSSLAFTNGLLDQYASDPSAYGYKVLHNETLPWTSDVGDIVGLFPITYLSRDQYNGRTNATDAAIYNGIAQNVRQRGKKKNQSRTDRVAISHRLFFFFYSPGSGS